MSVLRFRTACHPFLHAEWVVSVLLLIVAFTGSAKPVLISTGWDAPTPAQFREHVAEFEKLGVFDGCTLRPTRSVPGGGQKDCRHAFSRDPWHWEEFGEALADLRAATPVTCRETFLMVYANPGDVDWFDDEGWREIVNHWRLLSRLAKQGGLRGLLYDAEPYVKPFSQFCYPAQPERDQHTFDEYRAKARERGRQVMRVVKEEFPDAVILSYRLFSDLLPLLDSGDVNAALLPVTYGLQPAFVDGWMDVDPAGISIVEGTEAIGYRANSPVEYNAAFTRQRLRLPEFLSPPNRERFARQLRIGQSLFLDAHVNPPGSKWSIDRTGSSPAGRLTANLSSALAASDGIVWLYGEQARWWPGGKADSVRWVDKLPGALDAIRRAKDPAGFARSFWAGSDVHSNLLANAALASGDGHVPDGWFDWQAESSQGVITTVNGRVRIHSARDAVIGQVVEMPPGTVLAVQLRVKCVGNGVGSLSVGWKTADGQWTARSRNARLTPVKPPDADGWREITAVVEVPPEAGRIVFMPAAGGQSRETDVCWFEAPLLTVVPIP